MRSRRINLPRAQGGINHVEPDAAPDRAENPARLRDIKPMEIKMSIYR